MHAPPDRVFAADEILLALAEHRVDFVIVGGIAVQTHGYIRGTHDVDIVARPTTVNFSRVSEALADLGGELRTPGTLKLTDPNEMVRAPLIPVITRAGPLDIVHIDHIAGSPGDYDRLLDSALSVRVRGHEVAVAGLEDLIRMKRAAGRELDLTDIEALTRGPEST